MKKMCSKNNIFKNNKVTKIQVKNQTKIFQNEDSSNLMFKNLASTFF